MVSGMVLPDIVPSRDKSVLLAEVQARSFARHGAGQLPLRPSGGHAARDAGLHRVVQ